MKPIKLLSAIAFALLMTACGTLNNTAAYDEAVAALVDKAIDAQEFRMEVTFINPSRGTSRQTSDGYFLSIKDGVANSYLPFFGVSHGMAGFGTEPGGIEFDKCPVVIDDSQSRPEKGKYVWRFVAKTGSENVSVILTFWTNGSAQLTCNPQFRSVMNYSGNIVPFPVEKKKK